MRFGFHVSISGGLSRVPERAKRLGCECVQIFSRNPRSWLTKDLDEIELRIFKRRLKDLEIHPCVIHLPYLPNLSSAQEILLDKSLRVLEEDLKRANRIGAQFLVAHMGSRGQQSIKKALLLMSKNINSVLHLTGRKIMLLLENTSGGGRHIGHKFEHFNFLFEKIDIKSNLGVCLDTAHAFQSGYDLRTEEGLDRTLQVFKKYIGFKKLHLLHLNDSRTPLGSRIDRHWHIGKGYIGERGIRRIINHPLLSHLDAIMETPKKSDKDDLKNMRMVRSLQKKISHGL